MWVDYIFFRCGLAPDCYLVYVQAAWKKTVGSNKVEVNKMSELVPACVAMYGLGSQRSVGNGVHFVVDMVPVEAPWSRDMMFPVVLTLVYTLHDLVLVHRTLL